MTYLFAVLQSLVVAAGVHDAAPAEPRAYTVDREASQLWVVVHRAGLFSFLGHEHAIVPTEWAADLCLADPIPRGAGGQLVVQTPSLVIDSDSARALAHLGGGPDEAAHRQIQARMLEPDQLAAEQYPEIRLDLLATAPAEGDRVPVTGTITIRGVTRTFELPVSVGHAGDRGLVLNGTLRVRLRDFGIEPESRAGLVKVSNDVDLHFLLTALPTERPCATPAR